MSYLEAKCTKLNFGAISASTHPQTSKLDLRGPHRWQKHLKSWWVDIGKGYPLPRPTKGSGGAS